jgi:hypothetical protein
MTIRFKLVAASLVAVSALASSAASAGEATQAELLFREGRTLLDQKRYDEACPKLAESQKLEPGAGTLLALAMCHEGQGKPGTASGELKQASELGRKNGRNDLANAADKRARALEASVPHLVIHLPAEGASNYRVRCDGNAVPSSEINTPLAMDPGEHKVEVAAEGKLTKSYVVRITGAGTTEIVVDKLDDVPAAPAPAAAPQPAKQKSIVIQKDEPAPAREESKGGAQRTTGLILVGAGVVGLGVGAYFGGKALSESNQAKKICPSTASCPDGEAQDLNDSSKSSFKVSVISLAAGTGALTLGAVIYFLAPSASSARGDVKPPQRTAKIIPSASPSNAGLTVVGTF